MYTAYKVIPKVNGYLVTDTDKDSLIVFTGGIVNVLIGRIFSIVTPRTLGLFQYGFFAVAIATGVMVSRKLFVFRWKIQHFYSVHILCLLEIF